MRLDSPSNGRMYTKYTLCHFYMYIYTGANLIVGVVVGVDISTRLRMTLARATCVPLSKPNGEDNSFLRDTNELSLPFVFDNVTQATRANVIHNIVTSRFAPVI